MENNTDYVRHSLKTMSCVIYTIRIHVPGHETMEWRFDDEPNAVEAFDLVSTLLDVLDHNNEVDMTYFTHTLKYESSRVTDGIVADDMNP